MIFRVMIERKEDVPIAEDIIEVPVFVEGFFKIVLNGSFEIVYIPVDTISKISVRKVVDNE